MVIALDCLGKLISYNFFASPTTTNTATATTTTTTTTAATSAATAATSTSAPGDAPPPLPDKDDVQPVKSAASEKSSHGGGGGALERTPSGALLGIVDAELDGTSDTPSVGSSLIYRVVDIIHDSYTGETTDDKVQLQIFKVSMEYRPCML